ncbi:MAG TPA: tyrosine-type recombinase/integrase, partial [Nitrososphaeraceae archaeon]
DSVKWFTVKVGKDKKSQERQLDINEYLDEEEIKKIIEAAPTIQKKAFLACLYETGARPEEFLRLTNLDIKIDTNGAVFILRGKTGERRIRIVSFAPLLQQWLSITPLKHENQFPLWITEATNRKNQPLGLRGAENIIYDAMTTANLNHKHSRLYLLRHSRATHLASRRFKEAHLCKWFGWSVGTKVVGKYIHMAGVDLDDALAQAYPDSKVKLIKKTESCLTPKPCWRCKELTDISATVCWKCSSPLDYTKVYDEDLLRKEEAENSKHELLRLKFKDWLRDYKENLIEQHRLRAENCNDTDKIVRIVKEISVEDQMKGFMKQYKETDLEQLNALGIQPLKLKVYDILDLEIPEANFGEFVKEARRLSRGIQIKSDKSGNEILTFEGNNRKILE